jgi:hypothetical protein
MKTYNIPENIREIYIDDLGLFYYIKKLTKNGTNWNIKSFKIYPSYVDDKFLPSARAKPDVMGLGYKEDKYV